VSTASVRRLLIDTTSTDTNDRLDGPGTSAEIWPSAPGVDEHCTALNVLGALQRVTHPLLEVRHRVASGLRPRGHWPAHALHLRTSFQERQGFRSGRDEAVAWYQYAESDVRSQSLW
jgi:hypothetical protein